MLQAVRIPFFFFNDTATTEIYTLSLHDALPIFVSSQPKPAQNVEKSRKFGSRSRNIVAVVARVRITRSRADSGRAGSSSSWGRSEEHTSELQALAYLVCRLLLEKKKNDGSSLIP